MLRRRRRAVLLALLLCATVLAGFRLLGGPASTTRSPTLLGWLIEGDAAGRDSPHQPVSGSSGTSAVPSRSGRYVTAGTGRLTVVRGTGQASGAGPLERYMVEVEEGTGASGTQFADTVESTLRDPRSWGHGGAMSFQRVDAGPVAFRVVLASPRTVDLLCAPLDTNGYTSCYNGRGRSVLNLARWQTAVPWYAGSLTAYRQYMINHEIGHALGHGHEHCPGSGALAPVMQQQTLSLEGCRPNSWPYPSAV